MKPTSGQQGKMIEERRLIFDPVKRTVSDIHLFAFGGTEGAHHSGVPTTGTNGTGSVVVLMDLGYVFSFNFSVPVAATRTAHQQFAPLSIPSKPETYQHDCRHENEPQRFGATPVFLRHAK